MIIAGVKRLNKFIEAFPSFITYVTWFGILLLTAYGFLALKSTFTKQIMDISTKSSKKPILGIIVTVLSLSFLNPHVYLDTVILIGAIESKYAGMEQNIFTLGAITASFVWFFSLAYGSKVLIPLFKKPITWKCLDFFTACIMFYIAYMLFKEL